MQQDTELMLCKAGIDAWRAAFNEQDATGCAAQS